MYPIIKSQGKLIHKDLLMFPMEERGLQFGDGVYEVIRVYSGKPYLLKEHLDRLFRSLDAIQLPIPYKKETMYFCLKKMLKRNEMNKDGFIYLKITRGSAPRMHHFPEHVVPNMFAYVKERTRDLKQLKNGVRVITFPDERWDNCYIKSINLLPNVLARQAAYENGCFEAMLHRDGLVTECNAANVYLVKDGTIYTHPATKRILNGCVRMAVKRFAEKLNIPFIEEAFTLNDIAEADEMFLTSSTQEVLAIVEVDGKLVANGIRVSITEKLLRAYEEDAKLVASQTV